MKKLNQNGIRMTAIPNSDSDFNASNLAILHSELIPECTNTAGYSQFAELYSKQIAGIFNEADTNSLKEALNSISSADISARPALIAAFEAAHPALFKRLYGDLITFFYSTEEAQKRTRALADAAPREASAHFDPALLDAVIANQSGKRRL
jgi:hypothetical protein